MEVFNIITIIFIVNVGIITNVVLYFAMAKKRIKIKFKFQGSWMVDRGDWVGGHGDQFGPKHMMDEYVVVVTVNFRFVFALILSNLKQVSKISISN